MLLVREEVYWKRRSRIQWLKEGDKNTAFSHKQASQRRKTNTIKGLEDDNGVWCEKETEIESIATEYFRELFKSQSSHHIEEVLEVVTPCINEVDNFFLTAEFIAKEIHQTLKQMHPSKAPEPDGMPALFFQKFWSFIGTDVIRYCLSILNEGVSMTNINKTHIVLIPKIKDPRIITQYRPISLCNVIYKLVSKVLVNRLKIVLSKCISGSQSAFVPGRLIIDNVLVAYEMIHTLKPKKRGKEGHVALSSI